MPTAETWAILAASTAACVVVVELFFRLPFIASVESVNRASLRALDTVRSPRVSDHWKEKALVVYAGHLLGHSLQLSGLLLLAFALVGATGCLATLALDSGFAEFVMSAQGVAFATLLSLGYIFVRSRLVARQL